MKDLLYKILVLLSIAIALLTMATSCTREAVAVSYTVTEEDAAELTCNAILASYGGVLAQVNDAISIDQNHSLYCGTPLDSLLSGKNTVISSITFTSDLNWHSQLDCNTANLDNDYSGICNYDGPHFSSNGSLSGNLVLKTHRSPSYQITFNQNIDGSTSKKTTAASKLSVAISLNSTDLAVDASTRLITSGQISVHIVLSSSGNVADYSGTFKFLGNRKANLILNSGYDYPLSL